MCIPERPIRICIPDRWIILLLLNILSTLSKGLTKTRKFSPNIIANRKQVNHSCISGQLPKNLSDRYFDNFKKILIRGVNFYHSFLYAGLPGEIFLRLLKMMILPLIICSVISGRLTRTFTTALVEKDQLTRSMVGYHIYSPYLVARA